VAESVEKRQLTAADTDPRVTSLCSLRSRAEHVQLAGIERQITRGHPRTDLALYVFACLSLMFGATTSPAYADSLGGSRASLDRQNRVAQQHDFTYIQTPRQLKRFVSKGWLVRIRPNRSFRLNGVSFPYARPEVATFLQRLGAQYRSACGEKLVVTSLTRPSTRQPRNASDRSVHPTGMAMDLRYSRKRSCRRWLERVLLSLEGSGVLEATRERRPVHYHVALFPRQYTAYVSGIEDAPRRAIAAAGLDESEVADAGTDASESRDRSAAYTVKRGDSLWTIARRHSTTVRNLRKMNDLRSSRIFPGQALEVPDGG